ncbi:MAG: FAD-dependent oxidoreductase [Chloroflexota bacterium]
MAEKPYILAVDDEPTVLAAVVRDLQPHYGDRFRILRADSGQVALDTIREISRRNGSLALLVVDQRMPGMTGVEFLEQAIEIFPDVKRVLLTAYADTDAAISAINEVQLDLYLMKPWDPPEENLYPVLDELIDDWMAAYEPPFEGITIVGHRWSADSFELKDFLARNLVPYRWIDIEDDAEAGNYLDPADASSQTLPLVVFPDGSTLTKPERNDIVAQIGLESSEILPYYDLVIVGAGPAGLAGAVYGASEGLRTLLIERQAPGGQAGTSSRIENYLGFPAGLSGADLARRGTAQARRLGAEIMVDEAVGIEIEDNYRIIRLASGRQVSCQALLLTPGVSYRRLEVPGVERLHGAGVYYGASLSEASESADADIYIVGGANSAGQAATNFSKYARCVTLIVRGDNLDKSGMSRYLIDRLETTENIFVKYRSNVIEALGDTHLEALRIEDHDGNVDTVKADGLYIFIGAKPYTDWLDGTIALDGPGYVLTGPDLGLVRNNAPEWPYKRDPFLLETNVPGVFAAGDIRHRSMKRIASATGEGAMAIHFIHQYLRNA